MAGVLERLRLLKRASRPVEPALPDVARSVAIIMDGNARWARSRGLPVLAGHNAGTRALRRTVEACLDFGVDSLAVFAFSTENWNRPDDEVRGLLDLLAETIKREFPDMGRMGVRVRFVGRRDRCSPSILTLIEETERDTAANVALTLWICFDYGGRSELVEAARSLVRDGVAPDDVDERALASRLSAPDMPEPDLVIRTSGEQRLSNFLLWQAAYSEYVFMPTLWPDFGEGPLREALAEYAGRRRRFGAR
ncbi:MAG TPA: polyprenyl diphosphate synthase [Gaiellales bacterium]|jgi:undecaprenyl diphosphate synthase|nr:polyprenyl diphosphate synthase [Gaiellales bacterium]